MPYFLGDIPFDANKLLSEVGEAVCEGCAVPLMLCTNACMPVLVPAPTPLLS